MKTLKVFKILAILCAVLGIANGFLAAIVTHNVWALASGGWALAYLILLIGFWPQLLRHCIPVSLQNEAGMPVAMKDRFLLAPDIYLVCDFKDYIWIASTPYSHHTTNHKIVEQGCEIAFNRGYIFYEGNNKEFARLTSLGKTMFNLASK